jgi:D-aminopeptidase
MYEQWREIRNDEMDLLFQAAAEATEEAIINSLFAAKTTKARNGMTVEALPVEKTLEILRKYNRLSEK